MIKVLFDSDIRQFDNQAGISRFRPTLEVSSWEQALPALTCVTRWVCSVKARKDLYPSETVFFWIGNSENVTLTDALILLLRLVSAVSANGTGVTTTDHLARPIHSILFSHTNPPDVFHCYIQEPSLWSSSFRPCWLLYLPNPLSFLCTCV